MRRTGDLVHALPAAALLCVALVLTAATTTSLDAGTVRLFFGTMVPLGLIAVGLYPVLLSKDIDLSQFAVADLAGTTAALMANAGFSPVWVVLATCAIGGAFGLVNGGVVGYVRVNSFLATYCMSLVVKGVMFIATEGRMVNLSDRWLLAVGRGDLCGVPNPVFLFLIGFAALIFLMNHTVQGRKIVAVGSNATASRFSGIRVPMVALGVFLFSSLSAALSGLASISIHGSVATGLNLSVNLSAIVVVVFGGTDFDRQGRPVGILVGLVLYALLERGLARLGVQDYYLMLIQGGILLTILLCNALIDRVGPGGRGRKERAELNPVSPFAPGERTERGSR